jgi:CAAX protease family protein
MIQQPAMSEPKARVWKKIVCFYALTMLFSSVCGAFVLHAGKMDTGNLLYVTGAMWSLHASHNLFIQSILTPLTKDTGPTKFIIDEFGIGLVITVTIGAIIAWRSSVLWRPH